MRTLRPLSLSDIQQRPVLGLYCQHYRQLLKLEKRHRKSGIDVYEAMDNPQLKNTFGIPLGLSTAVEI